MSEDLLKTIADRRSIRQYTGGNVSREQLMALARAGMAAPSSRDTRHFYFILIDEEAVIQKLVTGLPYAQMLLTAKHAVIVASDLQAAHGGGGTDYWAQDCSAAAENVLLAAKAMGLGSCWTAAHPREERVAHVKQVLGLPDHIRPLCVIAVGISAGVEKPRDKFDATHVCWNHWKYS
jgi:nitroreductase